MKSLALLACLIPALASAEIIVPEDVQAETAYPYMHPALRSLVFVSPETRQMTILPPAMIFIPSPPLLMRAPSAMPAYPPVMSAPGFNVPSHPSNRDNVTYNLQRAHNFSQNLYRDNTYLYFGNVTSAYGWSVYGSTTYAPPAVPGLNQPARPRDNVTDNLERAHRFSGDGYRGQ